jgi:hypothetical protein
LLTECIEPRRDSILQYDDFDREADLEILNTSSTLETSGDFIKLGTLKNLELASFIWLEIFDQLADGSEVFADSTAASLNEEVEYYD